MGKTMSARQKVEAGMIPQTRPAEIRVPLGVLSELVRMIDKHGNQKLKGTIAFRDAQEAIQTLESGGCLDCGEE